MHTKNIAGKKFHVHVCNQNYCDAHDHEYLELTFLASGAVDHYINGEVHRVNAGDYFIVDHGTVHRYSRVSDEPLVVINILFFPEFIDMALTGCHDFEKLLESYLLKFGYKSLKERVTGKTFHGDEAVLAMVNEIANEYEAKEYGYYECIRCLLIKILITTMRKVGKSDNSNKMSPIIKQITEYVKKHYNEHFTLSDIANQNGYSLGYISKKFADEMGMSFTDYVKQVRIRKCCHLIRTTDMSISDIASAIGYDDIKHFNKVYKQQLGITPRQFKKMYK